MHIIIFAQMKVKYYIFLCIAQFLWNYSIDMIPNSYYRECKILWKSRQIGESMKGNQSDKFKQVK